MKIFILLLLLLTNGFIFSQEKVDWSVQYNKSESNVDVIANIASGCHLYSQYINTEIGPIPTQFSFSENKFIELIGQTVEGTPIEKFDENFDAKLAFFEGKSVFKQKINLKASSVLELRVTFMVCNDVMCLPPVEKQLSIELK